MNTIVNIAIVYAVVLSVLVVFVYPFSIGKEKTSKTTAGGYMFALSQAACMVILSGRAAGWW